jgi:hypothetical protein
VAERLDHRGEVIHPLDQNSLERTIARIIAEGLESVAICLVHAYANPAHERTVAEAIRERLPGRPVPERPVAQTPVPLRVRIDHEAPRRKEGPSVLLRP